MRLNQYHICVLVLLYAIVSKCEHLAIGADAAGHLDKIINTILESIRPQLAGLHLDSQYFETGDQEFGNINGNLNEVDLEGLDKFNVKVINTTGLAINNLTIEETFTAKGFYRLNGTLVFPMGKNDIRLFGDGEFSAKFTNLSVSLKLKIRSDNGANVVRDFDIFVGLDKIQLYFKNLMGGGDLEQVFNQLMNDVGLTIFNYYKEPVMAAVKPQIVKLINDLLNKANKDNIRKYEL